MATTPVSPTFLSGNLWAAREAHFTSVAVRALELLHANAPAGDENALNRELYFCMLKASRELDPEGIYPGPVAECCNQPDPDDLSRATRESKRPDFTWSYLDPHEPDPLKSSIQFVVECKRLGMPTNPQWVLNSNDWVKPRRTWLDATCPVYIDLGDDLLAKLETYDESGLPCVYLVATRKLVHDAMTEKLAAAIATKFYPLPHIEPV